MIDYSKFDEWFEAKFKGQPFSTGIFREAIKELCREAYAFGLVDFWDMGVADLVELSEKLGRPFNLHGTQTGRISAHKPNISQPPKHAEDLLEPPCAGCGRREHTLPPVYTKDGRKYCMETCTCPIHKKYHGGKYPQTRSTDPWDRQNCPDCHRVYEFMKKRKEDMLARFYGGAPKKYTPEEIMRDPDGYDEYENS